jgi:hypothetical protein
VWSMAYATQCHHGLETLSEGEQSDGTNTWFLYDLVDEFLVVYLSCEFRLQCCC